MTDMKSAVFYRAKAHRIDMLEQLDRKLSILMNISSPGIKVTDAEYISSSDTETVFFYGIPIEIDRANLINQLQKKRSMLISGHWFDAAGEPDLIIPLKDK